MDEINFNVVGDDVNIAIKVCDEAINKNQEVVENDRSKSLRKTRRSSKE